jgi:hypothetical protein
MVGKIAFAAAGLLMLGTLTLPTTTSAAPATAVNRSVAGDAGPIEQVHWYGHRHCRRVCHGHMHWNPWRGWHCHGHWHYRCHRHYY